MDSHMAQPSSTAFAPSQNTSRALHPTSLLASLTTLASSSLDDHINDYADAHRWIDSFFDKLQQRGPAARGAPRPAMSELMKTPGRKRVVGAAAPNGGLHSFASSKKDPIATLLFPGAPASSSSHSKKTSSLNKENSPASIGKSSPRKMLSPLGPTKSSAPKALSPMRMQSPRSVLSPNRSSATSTRPVPAPAPQPEPLVIAHDYALPLEQEETEDFFGAAVHDLSNVMEEAEDEDEGEEDEEDQLDQTAPVEVVAPAPEEEKAADLSVIGEEAEDDNEANSSAVTAQTTVSTTVSTGLSMVTAVSTQAAALASQSSFVAETQFSQPAPPSPQSAPVHTPVLEYASMPLSPQPRTVSGASSVAPEADGDTAVPLNDAPSALRTESFSSSVPASANTRTPGNTARFGAGSYSAAKLGMGSLGLGSSPPVAPSTAGKALADSRTSIGGNGARLNFVGLPKKSMGLGLGLGRNWQSSAPSTSSQVSDSQASSQGSNLFSHPQPSQPTSAASSTASIQPVHEPAQVGATTATGAIKRKSLNGPDAANKTAKLSPAPQTAQEQEQEEARKRREALANRIHSMQARQSNIAGRTSNVAGPFGINNMFASVKQLGPPSSMFLPISSNGTASKPLSTSTSAHFVSTASVITPSAEVANPLARRPSVMERVKSFEQTATVDHLQPPSPSKIPAAFGRSASPGPSPLSPRGMASPPASPRPLTRSAMSGIPTFASPKLAPAIHGLGFGSPKLGAATRSPPRVQAVASPEPAATISAILSPPPARLQQTVAPSPGRFVPPAITVKPTLPTHVVRSTTPDGTPPRTVARQQAPHPAQVVSDEEEDELDDEEEYEEDEEEEEEELSIRAVNSSTTPAAVAAATAVERSRLEREVEVKKAAEQVARDLEEQEAEREREVQLQKRLPSLPEAKPLTPDSPEDEEEDDEDEEMAPSTVSTAIKENLNLKASPSKIMMPGTFGAALASAAKAGRESIEEEDEGSEEGDDEEEEDDDEAEEEEEEDRTTMSMASQATTATFNFTSQSSTGPFKPVLAHKAQPTTSTSKSSLASSASALGLNRSIGNGASGLKKPEPKVKSIQRAAAAAKKEKEDRDRKNVLREEKRVALEKKKQDEDRKVKNEGLEKKRKEREEAATKAKANTIRGVKPKTGDDEPAKKRKIEPEQKARTEIKKAPQPSRPLTASASSQHVSLASSTKNGGMGPPSSTLNKSYGPSGALNKSAGPSSALNKSTGASSMIGTKFMSAQIRLPEQQQGGVARPGPTVPKPFAVSQSSLRPPQPHHTPAAAAKPDPEPYQELPEIDSEYSDSDDEEHEKKVASFPQWAQSPALSHALMEQRKVNPDDIFGPIPALSIQEIFRSSSSAARLRARTSSAQWEGTDALSQTDMARYHRVMGFSTGLHLGADGASSSRH